MENEKVVGFSMGKGILFALIGMIVGVAVWLLVIALLGGGTGGAIGGALAAVLGMCIAGGYQKGRGTPGAAGVIIVALLALIAAADVITFGTAILVYREGLGTSVFDALGITLDLIAVDSRLAGAFAQDLIISAGISVALAIVTMVGANKKAKAKETADQ